MRALQLDFIVRPSRLYRVGLWLLPLPLLLAAYLLESYRASWQELEGKQTKITQMRADWNRQKARAQAESEAAMPPAAREKLRVDITRANELIARLATPWDSLFDAIDNSVDGEIALLSISPNNDRKTVNIVGQAKDLSAMLAFQKRLNSLTLLKSAHVISHQIQLEDPGQAVNFEIDAQWINALVDGVR